MTRHLNNNSQIKLLPRIDYQNAGLEDLLKEVDVLELPQFEAPLILPPESTIDAKKVLPLSSASTREKLLMIHHFKPTQSKMITQIKVLKITSFLEKELTKS